MADDSKRGINSRVTQGKGQSQSSSTLTYKFKKKVGTELGITPLSKELRKECDGHTIPRFVISAVLYPDKLYGRSPHLDSAFQSLEVWKSGSRGVRLILVPQDVGVPNRVLGSREFPKTGLYAACTELAPMQVASLQSYITSYKNSSRKKKKKRKVELANASSTLESGRSDRNEEQRLAIWR